MSFIAYSGPIYTNDDQSAQQAAKSSIRNADGTVATAPTPIVSDHPKYPTSDPHIKDELWNNNGVLTVSAG